MSNSKKTAEGAKAPEAKKNEDKEELYNWFSTTENNGSEKIDRVKSIFEKTEATSATQNQIEIYTNNALEILNNLNINTKHKNELRSFALDLMNRSV